MSAPITASTVLGTIRGSRIIEPSPVARTQRPPIRWLCDELCDSCDRRTRVAIFDGAVMPCPRICADCMRAALGDSER